MRVRSAYEIFAGDYDLEIWRPYTYTSTQPSLVNAALIANNGDLARLSGEPIYFWQRVRSTYNYEMTATQAKKVQQYTGVPLHVLEIIVQSFAIDDDILRVYSAKEVHRECCEKRTTPYALGYTVVDWQDIHGLNRMPGEHPELEGFMPLRYERDDE